MKMFWHTLNNNKKLSFSDFFFLKLYIFSKEEIPSFYKRRGGVGLGTYEKNEFI